VSAAVRSFAPATLAIHAGQEPDPATGAIMTPIYATSTYVQARPGQHKGYEYSRTKNPTRSAFEAAVAALEGGAEGFAFGSGLAAGATVLELLDAGSHVIAGDDLYGGSGRLLEQVRSRSAGLQVDFVDLRDFAALERALRPETRLLWVESPTNPLLRVYDLEALAAWGREHGLLVLVDNTFATPLGQRPLSLGADVVLHSATKYLGGHSDLVAGIVVVGGEPRQAAWRERLGYLQNAVGAILGPFDSFLALRGLKTLPVRMERHSSNALALAAWLEGHPKVAKVLYPGLPSHPQHELARRQLALTGGMITVELKADAEAAFDVLSRFQVFALAESLGGVESLVEHPAAMTHGSVPPARREALGITGGLIRLSVGLEDLEDLRWDLDQALSLL
jgi:cystathionine gamma-lyase